MGARQSFPGSQTFPRSLSQSYGDASAIVLGQNLALEPYYERHSQQLLYGSNGNLATATQEGTTAAEKAAMARPVGGVFHNLYIFPVLVISGGGSDGTELQINEL